LFGRLEDKMKNKKGLILKNAFFAVIIVSVFILAAGQIVGTWSKQYNSGLTYDLNEYQDLGSFSKEAQVQQGKITPEDVDPGTGDFEGKLLRGTYGILGRIFLPFTSIWNMMEAVEARFSLPSYLSEAILSMAFFALIFSVVAIIFRLSRSTA